MINNDRTQAIFIITPTFMSGIAILLNNYGFRKNIFRFAVNLIFSTTLLTAGHFK